LILIIKFLETRFREITFLNAGLKIILEDKIKIKKLNSLLLVV